MMKRLAVFSLLLVFFYFLFWPGSGRNWVDLEIENGVSARKVAEQLKEKKMIYSSIPFLVWTRVRFAGPKIKAGHYRFSEGRSAYWVLDDLVNGRTHKIHLVIPEG